MSWKLYHADCLGADGLETLAGRSVAHVITEAPYGAQVERGYRRATGQDDKPVEGPGLDVGVLTGRMAMACAREFARVAKGWIIVFSDEESAALWRRCLVRAGARYVRTGRWVRLGGAPQFSGDRPAIGDEAITIAHAGGKMKWNGGGRSAVYTCPIVPGRQKPRHPTEKPQELMEAIVRDFTAPGDLILDPFAGRATTGAAAVTCGRDFLGFELNEKWWAAGKKRLEATRQQLELAPPRPQRLGAQTRMEHLG